MKPRSSERGMRRAEIYQLHDASFNEAAFF